MLKKTDKTVIEITTQEDLNHLVGRIQNGPVFGAAFSFISEEFREKLFSDIEIPLDVFSQTFSVYDHKRKIHISESYNGDIWISTLGLIAGKESTNNKTVNAFRSQYIVLCLLLDKAMKLCEDKDIYNIEGPKYRYLTEMTSALFHNIVFYFEIFSKAYLSLNNISFPNTHKLESLLKKVNETMYSSKHNDTFFHAYVVAAMEDIVKYIKSIPGDFREQYIKYADNTEDSTVIRFDPNDLFSLKHAVELANEVIMECCYGKKGDPLYLKQGLYSRLLEMAKSDEDRQRLVKRFSFLLI